MVLLVPSFLICVETWTPSVHGSLLAVKDNGQLDGHEFVLDLHVSSTVLLVPSFLICVETWTCPCTDAGWLCKTMDNSTVTSSLLTDM